MSDRVVVAISGASGPHYGVRMVEVLREQTDYEIHLILSKGARATIASGTFVTKGMVIAPCSIKTLSGVANSFNDNLVVRAADVCLKERRPLVLVVRETPLHLGHLKLMETATAAGAVVLPPVPGFYHRPTTIGELIDHTVMKALDQLGIHLDLVQRWEGL